MNLLYAPFHKQGNAYHGLLLDKIVQTTALIAPVLDHWVEQETADWVHQEGSLQRPTAPWADALSLPPQLATVTEGYTSRQGQGMHPSATSLLAFCVDTSVCEHNVWSVFACRHSNLLFI